MSHYSVFPDSHGLRDIALLFVFFSKLTAIFTCNPTDVWGSNTDRRFYVAYVQLHDAVWCVEDVRFPNTASVVYRIMFH